MKSAMKKGICVAQCAVLAAMIFALTGCGVPKDEHDALQKKYERTQQENLTLRTKNRELQTQVSKLTAENRTISAKCQQLLKERRVQKEAAAEKAKKTKEAAVKKAEAEKAAATE